MSGDHILEVDRLTMRFGGIVAVQDLSFAAERRKITALIGPNGAGKTTVFNCVTGFYKPTGGAMRLRHDDGREIALEVRDATLAIYKECAAYALTRGIIIADTKFEFGLDEQSRLTLIDEVLTPDSSRFWPADSYKPGANPPSFDKQYVRDYLESIHWNKKPPAPKLPAEVIAKTAEKYREALTRLTGTG